MNDLYLLKVKFFSNSIRKKPPCFKIKTGMRYSPHLVVEGPHTVGEGIVVDVHKDNL